MYNIIYKIYNIYSNINIYMDIYVYTYVYIYRYGKPTICRSLSDLAMGTSPVSCGHLRLVGSIQFILETDGRKSLEIRPE